MTYGPFSSVYGITSCAIALKVYIDNEREHYEYCMKNYEDLDGKKATEQDFYTALAWKNDAEHSKYAIRILERLADIFEETLTPEALNDIHSTFKHLDDYESKKAV